MKDGQKFNLGDAHITPRNIQEVQASKLGDAKGTPFFINRNMRSSFKTLFFIASYAMCCSWSVLIFALSFILFCFLQ
jgi:hypothetical protein